MRAARGNGGTAVWCAMVLAFLSGAAPGAQSHPDLSGRWVLETPPPSTSNVPLALSVSQSLVRTMERGPMKPFFRDLTIEREFDSGTRSETYQIDTVGERVPDVRDDASRARQGTGHSIRWDGNALVIQNGSYTTSTAPSGVRVEQREVWSLGPDGRLKVTITTRSSVDAPRTDTVTYRRQ
jgi:hypothetical protein